MLDIYACTAALLRDTSRACIRQQQRHQQTNAQEAGADIGIGGGSKRKRFCSISSYHGCAACGALH